MKDDLRSVTSASLHDYFKVSRSTLEGILQRPESYYRSFTIEENGKVRTIYPPISPLKRIQRIFLKGLYRFVHWPSYLHGGIPARSIITHAKTHLGQHLVVTYDVSNFFPTTTPSMVHACFASLGFDSVMADTLTRLVTYKNALPQGAPTSMDGPG